MGNLVDNFNPTGGGIIQVKSAVPETICPAGRKNRRFCLKEEPGVCPDRNKIILSK
jgi:hypothetical protein